MQGMIAFPAVRELAGRLLGITAMALSRDAAEALLGELGAGVAKSGDAKVKFEEAEGAIAGLGFVLAQCMTGMASLSRLSFTALSCMLEDA